MVLIIDFIISTGTAFAASNETSVIVGVTPREKEANKDPVFGGGYLEFDSTMENDYVTMSGKLYWRFSSASNSDEESHKIDVKKANIKIRPFGTVLLEVALGKLYSYALPGSFFQLSEIYTGASRWGKTGVGVKFEYAGFSAGLAVPVSESYETFKDSRGLHGGGVFDLSSIAPSVPVKIGGTVCYDFVAATKKKPEEHDWSTTVSILWAPKFNGLLKALSIYASYSDNSTPYVANSTFKKVSNYSKVGKADFASLSIKASVGIVKLTLESEFGRSVESDYIPLYVGMQALVPIVEHLVFKPRVYYYAAISTEDEDLSRVTYELYPRIAFNMNRHTVSAGADFSYIEIKTDEFEWEWSIPLYYECSF
ncbi:MAG: hypothetical protein K6G00_07275 [Treponema sp.]|nr:hypothetical protein [Treponema sp.]